MTRTPARFTQADIARATRAAKQAGAGAVEVLPDGTIRISLLAPETAGEKPDVELATRREVVL